MIEGASESKRSWEEIVADYDELVLAHPKFAPIRDLVCRLAALPNASELESNTSHHTLLVSTAPARSWFENVLRISYLPESDEFEFQYSHYYGEPNTKKRCSASDAWDQLARFVRYKFGMLLPHTSET